MQCDDPPAVCTGDPEIDAVLQASNVGCLIGLTSANTVYTWTGFCDAVRLFHSIDGTSRRIYLGEDTGSAAHGLANIAALLAQCMWESGGDAPFTACDENNYRRSETAACTQRADKERYDSLSDRPWHCEVDKSMTMTAETAASWAPGPLRCVPGTVTEGCCWWGRGAIQTTGPNNYGLLNQEVISKIPALVKRGVDVCTNPEAMCQHPETRWIGALFYWANDVQGYTDERYRRNFRDSLDKFVGGNFSRAASTVSGADFAAGTGGVVNNGFWEATPHENAKRVAYFDEIIDVFRKAGMLVSGA